MQIKKTYTGVTPELLYDEIRDFVIKQGAVLDDAKMETYSLPSDSSSFISRGTLSFKMPGKAGRNEEECLRAHIVGSAKGETKLMLDINDKLFPSEKALEIFPEFAENMRSINEMLLENFSEDEKETVFSLLKKLSKNIENIHSDIIEEK